MRMTPRTDHALVVCTKPEGGACVQSPVCHPKGVVSEARHAYLAVFGRYVLADLVVDRSPKATLRGMPAVNADLNGAEEWAS